MGLVLKQTEKILEVCFWPHRIFLKSILAKVKQYSQPCGSLEIVNDQVIVEARERGMVKESGICSGMY